MNQVINLQTYESITHVQGVSELHLLSTSSTRVVLPVEDGYLFRKPSDIISAHADGSYCKVVCVDGKDIYLSKTLKFVEAQLSSANILRIHNSHLINPDYMIAYCLKGLHSVNMCNGITIPIDRARKSIINSWMEKIKVYGKI